MKQTLLLATETTTTSLLELISQGGWAMIPLGGASMVMLFLIIQGAMLTRRSRHHIFGMPISGSEPRAWLESLRASTGSDAPGRQVVEALVTRLSATRERSALEESVLDATDAVHDANAQWIQYLNVVAAISPMIGLLGTVSGMIGAFQKIGLAGMGKPEELAGNIGEALITTATGLVIAIPAMIAFFILRNRNANARRELVGQGLRVADCLLLEPCPGAVSGEDSMPT